jgi:hypothetical protein
MRMTRQAPAPATDGLMFELKAKGQDEDEDELDKRLAIVKQTNVGAGILEINGDGAVFTDRFGWR